MLITQNCYSIYISIVEKKMTNNPQLWRLLVGTTFGGNYLNDCFQPYVFMGFVTTHKIKSFV